MDAGLLLFSLKRYQQKYQQNEKRLGKTTVKAVQSRTLKGISYAALNWSTSAPAASLSK